VVSGQRSAMSREKIKAGNGRTQEEARTQRRYDISTGQTFRLTFRGSKLCPLGSWTTCPL
jgi:hypothetical protein